MALYCSEYTHTVSNPGYQELPDLQDWKTFFVSGFGELETGRTYDATILSKLNLFNLVLFLYKCQL